MLSQTIPAKSNWMGVQSARKKICTRRVYSSRLSVVDRMRKLKSGIRRPPAKSKARPKNIDDYLARVPEPARGTLKKLRAAIRSAAPRDATETISYGIPAFKYKGVLVWFAAFSNHCSLFPTAAVIEAFKDDLKGYSTSKGTIHFPTDKPFPAALVRKLVKARVAQIESRQRR
jgi:uncharacterized protein YdhG (YjbR/CyaY superfamily)